MNMIQRVVRDIKCRRFVHRTVNKAGIPDLKQSGKFHTVQFDFLALDEKEKIIQDADRLLDGKYQIFNYPVYTFKDWNVDPVTKIRIPVAWCTSLIRISNLYNRADVKNYWDQSHLYGAVTLGQAYKLTGNEDYAKKSIDLMLDWITRNPVGTTVSWKCPMDIAIRVANMVLSLSLLSDSSNYEQHQSLLIKSLYGQVIYITNNYENTGDTPNNHYLSDLAGVIWGCAFLDMEYGVEGSLQLLRDTIGRLDEEMIRQVHSCGMDYEHSVYYHCFVTELVAETISMLQSNKYEVPVSLIITAEKMVGTCDYLGAFKQMPLPLFGDQDGSRLFLFRGFFDADRCDFRHLARFPKSLSDASDGGIYRMQAGNYTVFMKCGPVGTAGKGTHDHNDQLSVCIYYKEYPLVIDGGTYAYTFDLSKRNVYRSEKKHSNIVIDKKQQSSLDNNIFAFCANGEGCLETEMPLLGKYIFATGEEISRQVMIGEKGISLIDHWTANRKGKSQLLCPFPIDSWQRTDGSHLVLKTSFGLFSFCSDHYINLNTEEYSPVYGQEYQGTVLSIEAYGDAEFMIGGIHSDEYFKIVKEEI